MGSVKVVNLILDKSNYIENVEDKKIIDPACGEGVFLRVALERGLTAPERCYGLDRDPSVVDAWQRQGWWPNAAGPHLSVHDGLCEPTSSLRWLRDADFERVRRTVALNLEK